MDTILAARSLAWLLDAATDAMLIADDAGRIVLSNGALARMFRYPPGALAGQPLEILLPEAVRGRHARLRAQYAAHPRPRAMGEGLQLAAQRADGSSFPVEVSLSPLHDDAGVASLVLATVHDITARKAAEDRAQRLLLELTSANEELSNFAYIVSHDLKAPLRGIGTLADWIAADQAHCFDDEGREHLRLLINRTRRMGALIDGILEYSRVGRVREKAVHVDLDPVVAEVVDLLGPHGGVVITVAPAMPTVLAEPTRIRQVFHNLISNALRYMDKPAGRVSVDWADAGAHWRFTVADNGPGIEPRHFERIFQPFQTLAPRDRVESTGVGLALVRKIVEMYGGTVGVASCPGAGATFSFTLPKQEQR